MGSGAAALVIAGGLLLATSVSSSNTSPAGQPGNPVLDLSGTSGLAVRRMVNDLARSLVLLSVTTARGTTQRCAITVSPGGLVVTAADGVVGATALTAMTESGGRSQAQLVAADPASDVALVRLSTPTSSPRFIDDNRLRTGNTVISLTLSVPSSSSHASSPSSSGDGSQRTLGGGPQHTPNGGSTQTTQSVPDAQSAPSPSWSLETVSSVAARVPSGYGAGMAGIETVGSTPSPAQGSVLVSATGRVIGLKDNQAAGPGANSEVFLPSALVLGVAGDLASTGQVTHGWLGVHGRDGKPATTDNTVVGHSKTHGRVITARSPGSRVSRPGPSPTGSSVRASTPPPRGTEGALVTAVNDHGPSAGRLQPGDVIVALNGAPVRSMAELRSRLYVLPAGSSAHLNLWRHGGLRSVTVVLGRSP